MERKTREHTVLSPERLSHSGNFVSQLLKTKTIEGTGIRSGNTVLPVRGELKRYAQLRNHAVIVAQLRAAQPAYTLEQFSRYMKKCLVLPLRLG